MSDKILYTDIPIDGGFSSSGEVNLLTNADAISNALTYFLTAVFPYLFNLDITGITRQFMNKPLTISTATTIKQSLTTAIEQFFSPALIIHTLTVTPGDGGEEWDIKLIASTADTYTTITLEETILAISKGVS